MAFALTSEWYGRDHLNELYPQLQLGDCLEYKRSFGYCHWALYSGPYMNPNGRIEYRIIHRSVPPDLDLQTLIDHNKLLELISNKSMGIITETTLEAALSKEDAVRINNGLDRFWQPLSGKETITRAMEKMLEFPQSSYNLLTNNCEHFVNECRYKRNHSQQVIDGYLAAIVQGSQIAAASSDKAADLVVNAQDLLKKMIPAFLIKKSED